MRRPLRPLQPPALLASFALAPWLFLSLVLALDRRSRWGLPLLAGTVFWLFTAGYAGVILTLALWGAAFALLLAWRQPLLPAARVRLLGGCVAAVGLGCAMAAVNWLPFAVRVDELTRGAAMPADVVLSSTHSLQPKHLLGLLLPFFPVAPFPGTEVDITFRGIYLGGVALSLAAVCVTWSRGFIVAALAGAAVGSLLMSLGGNFFGRVALHAVVPLFNFSQYPAGDSTFLAMLALSLLAAGGAVLLARAHAPSLELARRALRSLLVLYLVALVGLTLVYGKYDDRVVSGVTFEAFCMLLALLALERGRGPRLYPLLAGVALLELGYSATVNFDVAGRPMPTAEYGHLLDSRVVTFSGAPPAGPRLGDPKALSDQSSSIAFLNKSYYVGEYNPARLKTYDALVAAGFVSWLKDGPRMAALPPDGSPPKFDAFKARVSDVTFSIHEYMPNRLRFSVQVPKDALLVLNEIYFPGWRATVDGRADARGPGGRRPARAAHQAGSHEVELRFRPIEYFVALALSLAGLIAFVAWLVVVARRRPVAAAVADPSSPLTVGVRAVDTGET